MYTWLPKDLFTLTIKVLSAAFWTYLALYVNSTILPIFKGLSVNKP